MGDAGIARRMVRVKEALRGSRGRDRGAKSEVKVQMNAKERDRKRERTAR